MLFSRFTLHASRYTNPGFTLAELLAVVAIIATLTSVMVSGSVNVLHRAQAQRIANDFKEIETAWQTWRVDSGMPYPPEGDYSKRSLCKNNGNEVADISETDLYENKQSENNNWRGPYLDVTLMDPWGNQEYGYDNDISNVYTDSCASGEPHYGVNVTLDWCNEPAAGSTVGSEAIQVREHIDQIIDGEVSGCSGKFRWVETSWGGRLFYLIDADGSQ